MAGAQKSYVLLPSKRVKKLPIVDFIKVLLPSLVYKDMKHLLIDIL